ADANCKADQYGDGKPREHHAVLRIHELQRQRGGERHIGWDRQVDIAGAERDDKHLPEPDDHRKRREGEGCVGKPVRARATGEEDGDDPYRGGRDKRPDPWTAGEYRHGVHCFCSLFSRRLRKRRKASTTIRIPPCAPICQSGEMRMKERNEPARVSVSAPMTAPMGETRPPTNSPPPRMTPAMDSSV